ncbi:MAG: CTP synthase, partial [bacterium]
NLTAGQVYLSVIEKERRGDYLGRTIQVVPHITGEIKDAIRRVSDGRDVVIVEIGGTVGDIEGLPFMEAARQFALEEGRDKVFFVHLTLVPYIRAAGEFKTKPTQHSVKELRDIGIQPDVVMCRAEQPLPRDARAKIALFCNVRPEAVIEAIDVPSIYRIPLVFHRQKLDALIVRSLRLKAGRPDLKAWTEFVLATEHPGAEIEIGVCGKYVGLHDAYKSVIESINHAAGHCGVRARLRWLEAEELTAGRVKEKLAGLAGLIVPGGFGSRGMEGKILAVRHCREQGLPYLGLCVGLQIATIEFARSVCGLHDANSTEFCAKTKHPVIYMLPGQRGLKRKGGTMRLGAWPCRVLSGTMAARCYRRRQVSERHRHRYEVNNRYLSLFEQHGLVASGREPEHGLVEIIELRDHPFFVACQFHPEFKSRPLRPHPLFAGFMKAACERASADADSRPGTAG